MPKSTKKKGEVKVRGYVILCSTERMGLFAFEMKNAAVYKKKQLDQDLTECKHRIIPCTITYTLPNKKIKK